MLQVSYALFGKSALLAAIRQSKTRLHTKRLIGSKRILAMFQPADDQLAFTASVSNSGAKTACRE
jgi:hypothetical protein